jgi:hypothetical protein
MSDRLCDICGDYKELCGHDFLYAEIKKLKAENQRLRELGREVADQLDECRSQLVALLLQEQGE